MNDQDIPQVSEPGRTGPQGEGGGVMSGRGQEQPGSPRGPAESPQIPSSTPSDDEDALQAETDGGLASPLQPGGVEPGGGPGATQGSIGTGGGATAGRDTGDLKRGGL